MEPLIWIAIVSLMLWGRLLYEMNCNLRDEIDELRQQCKDAHKADGEILDMLADEVFKDVAEISPSSHVISSRNVTGLIVARKKWEPTATILTSLRSADPR